MTDPGSRWSALFEDLEAQTAEFDRAERAGEIDERTRGEVMRLGLDERLRASTGLGVRLRLAGALVLNGQVERTGPGWLLLDEGGGREALLNLGQLLGVRGLGRYAASPGDGGVVTSRLGLPALLRGIARDRSGVRVHLADGSTVDATLDRVGSDFAEFAVHPAGEARRARDVREVEIIPLAAIAAVRRSR